MTDGRPAYEIGYGKPPAETRFKPGQSGNPRGRKRGRKNFRSEIADILEARVTITEGGKKKTVSSRAAALMRLREKALKGDAKAMDRLFQLAAQHASEEDAAGRERALTIHEEDILARYVESQTNKQAQDTGPNPAHAIEQEDDSFDKSGGGDGNGA